MQRRHVSATDFDGDGDQDVLTARTGGGSYASWFENLNGQGEFGTEKIISLYTYGVETADIGDIDGDVGIVIASELDRDIAWFKNSDGEGTFDEQIFISGDIVTLIFHPADMDGDDDLDLMAISSSNGGSVVWYENLDGYGHFGQRIPVKEGIIGSNRVAVPADLDADGDMDIVGYLSNQISWLVNGGNENSAHVLYVLKTMI